jgi:signal transduction histidine kinase
MRRRLALLSLAVGSLVVIAFLIPLAILVRNQAENRALSRNQTVAQAIATTLAVTSVTPEGSNITDSLARTVLEAFGPPPGVTIVLADGSRVGAAVDDLTGAMTAQRTARAFTGSIPGGAEVLVPVLLADAPVGEGTVVVRSFVSDAELRKGVTTAWVMLGGLGVFLIIIGMVAADRLGRSVVRPITELSAAARSLGVGDLGVRVHPAGPAEISEVGEAFNFLAGRLGALLSAERESVADLSHRLRTPLTALRLQAETLSDPGEAEALRSDVDRLEEAMNRLIEDARRPSADDGEQRADLATVVRHRAAFWKVVADEQGRRVTVHTTAGELSVAMHPRDLGAMLDTLIENVFAHTPPETAYTIRAEPAERGLSRLVVEDDGPGFPDQSVLERGASAGGSTGLGLDIVRRAAERTGGRLSVTNRREGGARVEVVLGADVPVA